MKQALKDMSARLREGGASSSPCGCQTEYNDMAHADVQDLCPAHQIRLAGDLVVTATVHVFGDDPHFLVCTLFGGTK